MKYMELRKCEDRREADKEAKKMGWKDDATFKRDTGASLVGYWVPGDETDIKDQTIIDSKIEKITPIAIIVHGRLYPENARGFVLGKRAWITSKEFEELY